jgi:hypothetical protein
MGGTVALGAADWHPALNEATLARGERTTAFATRLPPLI